MINQNSPIIQNMIANGQFGYNGPNNYGYQQPMYNNYYQQPQQYYGYGYQQSVNYGYQQQQNNYYNPYGDTFKNVNMMDKFKNSPYAYGTPDINTLEQYRTINNSYGYANNNYTYGNNYNPYNNYKQQQNEQITLYKMKLGIASTYFGHPMSDEEMNNMIFPQQEKQQRLTDEERINNAEYDWCANIIKTVQNPYRQPTNAELTAQFLYQMSKNMHDELDNHGLCQFLEDDLWQLQREQWLRENIDINSGRNLKNTYSSKDYTELLNMHNDSAKSGFVSQLLDTSRYDNNTKDIELGMNLAFNQERRRRSALEEKVPSFISSDEVQKRRNRFTNAIMQQIYKKGGGGN